MENTNFASLCIRVDGVTTEASAMEWIEGASADVRAVTYFEDGKLWQRPFVEDGAFVDPTARLMGGIIVRSGCYVGPYAVVRLDEKESASPLVLDENSNLQDGSVVHADTTRIGKAVIVAHQSIVHGAIVEDDVTIYIQAVVEGGGTVIGKGSFLHRGAYVGKNIKIPANSYVAPGVCVLSQADADALPKATDDLLAIRDRVLMLNKEHVARYLKDRS